MDVCATVARTVNSCVVGDVDVDFVVVVVVVVIVVVVVGSFLHSSLQQFNFLHASFQQ